MCDGLCKWKHLETCDICFGQVKKDYDRGPLKDLN